MNTYFCASMLVIKNSENMGRGVFTTAKIKKGSMIEICPVVVCPPPDRKFIDKTFMYNYYFLWEDDEKSTAIALGYGSLYNHSYSPNAVYEAFYEQQELHFTAHRDIYPGEEITVNYNCDPENQDLVWFDKEV
jgi:uncharacterized protein